MYAAILAGLSRAALSSRRANVSLDFRPVISVQGIRVELDEGRDGLLACLVAAPHRFMYVSYRVLHSPERLVVDLWKSAVPIAGAAIRDDGCLRITKAGGGPDVVLAGRELAPAAADGLAQMAALETQATAAAGGWERLGDDEDGPGHGEPCQDEDEREDDLRAHDPLIGRARREVEPSG